MPTVNDNIDLAIVILNECALSIEEQQLLSEIFRLARLGAAVEAMPANSSLHNRPLNDDGIFPIGTFRWVFASYRLDVSLNSSGGIRD
jgi:hypothetical protein